MKKRLRLAAGFGFCLFCTPAFAQTDPTARTVLSWMSYLSQQFDKCAAQARTQQKRAKKDLAHKPRPQAKQTSPAAAATPSRAPVPSPQNARRDPLEQVEAHHLMGQ